MKYNLITLKMFLTVARTGSIAQASEAENVAASAISKRISDLEDQIGTQLFYRQTRGVESTPAGHQLARHSSNILQLVEQMDSQMLDFASGAKGSVRIAANTSAITQFLPEDLAGFVDQYPDVRIDLSELTSDEILSAVRAGFADLGIFSGMVEEPELDILTYRRDTLVLVMGQDHAFRPTHPVKLAEFAMLDMVGLQARYADVFPLLNAIRNDLFASADEIVEADGSFRTDTLKRSELIALLPHASFHRALHKLIDKDFIKKKEDFGRAHYFLLGFQLSEITK
jgi:DNA-binding transcriptional LysR family regulator